MRFLRMGLIGGMLAGLVVPRAAPAATHRVAIVESSSSRVPRGEAAGLRADIEEVAGSLGAEVVPLADSKAAAGRDCKQPDCMIAIHSATGATHVLRAESVFKKGAFVLQLQMWDARTGKTLSSDGTSCDICTLPDLHAALRDRVAALCTRVFEAEEPPPAPEPASAPVTVPPSPPPALNVATPAAASQPAPPSYTGKRFGQVGSLALAALGMAAAAYGGYLLYLDGRAACCAQKHVTAGPGAGFLAGGIVATVSGGVLFYSLTW